MRICLVCGLIKESENCIECSEDVDLPFDQELDFEDGETPPEGEALDFTE